MKVYPVEDQNGNQIGWRDEKGVMHPVDEHPEDQMGQVTPVWPGESQRQHQEVLRSARVREAQWKANRWLFEQQVKQDWAGKSPYVSAWDFIAYQEKQAAKVGEVFDLSSFPEIKAERDKDVPERLPPLGTNGSEYYDEPSNSYPIHSFDDQVRDRRSTQNDKRFNSCMTFVGYVFILVLLFGFYWLVVAPIMRWIVQGVP